MTTNEQLNRRDVPGRYRYSVIPHVMVDGAAAAIDFYAEAFGAKELFKLQAPDGQVMHAEIEINGSALMLGDAAGVFTSPSGAGGPSVALHVFVDDVDALADRAVTAGAELLQPPMNMFHGDRTAILRDPYGHVWVFLTHLEDVSPEEIVRRAAMV
ncbi:VOC family protein [Streptomyces sp. NPDC058644]|uniref:VOC family protein n=1 Tax=unclassified Streptomyces TaxID=2593676 RepID=UPI003666E8D8